MPPSEKGKPRALHAVGPKGSVHLSTARAEALLKFLEELDSHVIYLEMFVVSRLAMCGIEHEPRAKGGGDWMHRSSAGVVRKVWDGLSESTEHARQLKERGLGGSLKPGPWRGVTGHVLIEQLCSLLGLGNPGVQYYGRGRQFTACLVAIGKAYGK